MSYFAHESSYIDEGVKIGQGTKIWFFCHVQKGSVIGDNCSLGQNVNIANNVKIGNGVKIQNNVAVIPLQKAPFECPYCRSTSGHGGENQSKIESEQGLKPTYWVHQ
jgi:acyl-[acyl carrier protein]--UDP-N-acetylglucosamine O-acyltransferase